jgi:isocitrate dehydrogenase
MLTKIQMRSFATFKKVKVSGVVVDIDGDEMTKIIWKWIKEKVRTF